MDRNQVIGLVLIAVILFGYIYLTKPSKEQILREKQKRDSIALVQEQLEQNRVIEELKKDSAKSSIDSIYKNDTLTNLPDSSKKEALNNLFGSFAEAANGNEKFITVENNNFIVTFSNKGGRIYSVELKNFKTYDSLPLILFNGDKNIFGFDFFSQNKSISTQNFYFIPQTPDSIINATSETKTLTLRLNAGNNSYIDYVYTIKPDEFIVDFNVIFKNPKEVISQNANFIDLNWNQYIPYLERGNDWENQNTLLYYKFFEDEVDFLSHSKDEESEKLSTSLQWIGYKHQFFSSVLIAKQNFNNAVVDYKNLNGTNGTLKVMNSKIAVPTPVAESDTLGLAFYFGPNHYKTLRAISLAENDKLELKELVPLGWGIFGWVNRIAIIPVFNWLGSFITSYGLIILLLTIIIKAALFPLTFKSYQSSAKMRVLKPQVDELAKKFGTDKAMEKQQATMALYRKVGVNPLGGCLPVLLQMPILIAMFRFFPSSIELRQQSFLWAEDLSSYDSILQLPFTIPMYGDHVSLFTLLMAAAIVISTKMNSNQMDASSQQIPGMKMMMYMMPVMMVVWFNSYSSGLSYYYFLSNVITIAQTYLIRYFTNEEAILQKLNANAKKNKNQKKSKFQQKLEDMAKQRGVKLPK